MKRIALLLAGVSLLPMGQAHADEASLQAEIALLKQQVAAQNKTIAAQATRLDQLEARMQVTPAASAQPAAAPAAVAATTPDPSSAVPSETPAAATAALGADTTIGGYGEFTYNGYVHDASRNQADLARFVLFFGHRFNDKLTFNSELEIEHAVASSSDRGEAEIEQAWLNYAFKPSLNLRAGLFLMPFGFLNRNHEPPVFYGVERNEVETRIIPSTWREGGVSLWGETSFGLAYDVGVTTGFDVAKFDDPGYPLAATHQELQLAHAASPSFYGSLEYKGVPGLFVGGAVFHGGALHANADHEADPTLPDFAGVDSSVTLWDVHGRWQHKGLDLQALYARGTYSNADALDSVLVTYNAANSADRPMVPSAFYGWLVQGAYSIPLHDEITLSPFVRYEVFNTQASLPLGLVADPANRDRIVTAGFSFHPLPEVVVKFDYQKFFENKANDRVNLGLGYMF
jgi:hypothetical protein